MPIINQNTAPMKLKAGDLAYDWIDNWVRIPDTESGRANGRTHGVEVTEDGRIIVFNQADPAVLIFDAEGNLLDSWGDRFGGAHGLTLVYENGEPLIWLTDQYTGEVVKTTLGGRTVLPIGQPDHPIYGEKSYSPTWVAVNEERHGGNGDIWVTDGYGSHHIHRYDRDGRYVNSINGEEGKVGAFDCPHAIFFDFRRGEPELYIADRSNRRVQVYDSDGHYKRAFGSDFLTSPCSFFVHGGMLLVPELFARVTLLDENDRLIGHLGENDEVMKRKDWPEVPRTEIKAGHFNSPHDMAADAEGNLYVVEWLVGGRITKLELANP